MFHSFLLSLLMYAVVAIMGYLMFGESTLSQITLNLPDNTIASKVALWVVVSVNLLYLSYTVYKY